MVFTRQLFRKMSDDILKKQNVILNTAWKYAEDPQFKKRISKRKLIELNAHVLYELQRRGIEFSLELELNRHSFDKLAQHSCENCDCGMCSYSENAATTSSALGVGVNEGQPNTPEDTCPKGQVRIGTEGCFAISE